MYPDALERTLKKNGISIGDRVQITHGTQMWEGVLMPRASEKPIWVLKLDNGYNIGIPATAGITRLAQGKKPAAAADTGKHRGEIAVLGCGGTIASKVEYKTGAVYPAITPEELRRSFPELERIATIHTKQLFALLSEDMTVWHWQKMAEACAKEIKEGAKGIVLMHGTDTMGYSAAALSFLLRDVPVPVIVVGAQRSSDRPSSDNKLNLLNAIFAAKQDFAEVAVCMHGSTDDTYAYIHRGTRVRKMHTSRRDAFQSVNALPLAKADYRANQFQPLSEYRKRSDAKLQPHIKMNENVALVYIHPGIQPQLIRSLKNYDGVVLAVTGLGHVPTNAFNDEHAHSILPEVKGLVESGIPVVLAPQTLHGRLNLNVYTAGRVLQEAGVIGDGMDWLPETAFVKLMWALGQTKNKKKVRALMETNIAGEISERSKLEW